jgi:hypothetical protein
MSLSMTFASPSLQSLRGIRCADEALRAGDAPGALRSALREDGTAVAGAAIPIENGNNVIHLMVVRVWIDFNW